MPQDPELTDKQSIMHARCDNWGRAMSGGYPGNGQVTSLRPEPDLLDALEIERGMCAMRRDKKRVYRLFKFLYLGNHAIIEAALAWRKTEYWIKRNRNEGLQYLIRYFSTESG